MNIFAFFSACYAAIAVLFDLSLKICNRAHHQLNMTFIVFAGHECTRCHVSRHHAPAHWTLSYPCPLYLTLHRARPGSTVEL